MYSCGCQVCYVLCLSHPDFVTRDAHEKSHSWNNSVTRSGDETGVAWNLTTKLSSLSSSHFSLNLITLLEWSMMNRKWQPRRSRERERERKIEDGLRASSLCLQRTRLSCVVFIFCMLMMMMMMMPEKMISYSTKHRYTDIPDYSLGLMKKGKKRERISNEWMTFEVKREEKLFAQ